VLKQFHARRATCENRAAGRFQHARLRHVGHADFVVNLRGFVAASGVHQPFRAEDAAFGDGRPRAGGSLRQRRAKRLGRHGVSNATQSHGRRRRHRRVVVAEPLGEHVDGLGVATHADRVDHADQHAAFELAGRLAESGVGFGAGNHFQRRSRP
jgi:hypothetical protein